jgi:hypothetical protein
VAVQRIKGATSLVQFRGIEKTYWDKFSMAGLGAPYAGWACAPVLGGAYGIGGS